MTKKIRTYITLMLLFLCQSIVAQNKTPTNDSPCQNDLGIFALPSFERAVRCIKYYEGWHDIKRNYPYIGWGHRILPHEKFKKNLTYQQADSLLRSDLTKLCAMFRFNGLYENTNFWGCQIVYRPHLFSFPILPCFLKLLTL